MEAREQDAATSRDGPQLSEQEIAQRRDEALRRALNTPHKPHEDMRIGKKNAPAQKASRGAHLKRGVEGEKRG